MHTSMEGPCFIESLVLVQRHGMSECMPFGRPRGALKWHLFKQPNECHLNFGMTELGPLKIVCKCGQTFWPTISLQRDLGASGREGVNDCYLMSQQHGSSRKVTLKSSCGHSMVPTARAYAGLCQAIQTALSGTNPLSMSAQSGAAPVWNSGRVNVCVEGKSVTLLFIVFVCIWVVLRWKHAQSSQ